MNTITEPHHSASPQPVDQPERQRALDTRASFAVSAPAGSGKTGLLTQRVLALLAQCEEPENVLAITFTRKAAAEMQARILDALREAEKQPHEPEADYEKATWHLAQAVLKRNQEKQWELFHCPNRLRITTIDSLCRSLSQQMPFESQLGHTPEILDNVDTAYRLAARETLKALSSDNALSQHLVRLVKHFNNQLEQIETLFMQLLAKRDQWLSIIFQTKDQRSALEAILREVIEEHLSLTQAALSPIASELTIMADHAANNFQQHIATDKPSPITHCLGLTDLPDDRVESIPQWLGLAELLLTKKGELRKSATKAIGFFAPSDKTLSPEQKANAKAYKARMGEVFSQCATEDSGAELIKLLHGVRALPSAHYPEAQWELLDSLSHVLINLASTLSITFQQLSKTDYLAVTLAAIDALGEPEAPTDLALALDYKIQHILVDEFQDTSTTQLQLLQRLTAGWQNNDGRTLFVVGDAMQSCYRFRDANVGIFLDVRQHGVGDIALEPVDLQVNFRSQQGVVEWVNRSFQTIFPADNNSHRGAVRYSPSTSFKPALDMAPVQSHIVAYHDSSGSRKEEAIIAASIVEKTHRERPRDTIALLVRGKAHAQAIISHFNDIGIDYQANDIDRLNTCMPVLDLLSLTKALLHPHDRMAWLAVLRAPWCGVNMEDLYTVVHYQPNTLVDALQRFSEVILSAQAQQKRLSLRLWIQGIWLALGGPALLINAHDESNVHTFFGLLDRYEQGGIIPQWDDIEKAVNELYAKPTSIAANDNAAVSYPPVEIMTIHKSKGLEFDTVIIPGLDKRSRGNDKELLLWLERTAYSPITHRQESQLLISPVNATGENKDPIYHFIQQQHNEKEQLESDRLLYVGCTRAIKQLHLVAYAAINHKEDIAPMIAADNITETLKAPSQHCLLSRLWPTIIAHPHSLSITTVSDAPQGVDTQGGTPIHSIDKLSHPNYITALVTDAPLARPSKNDLLSRYRGNNALAAPAKHTISDAPSKLTQGDLFADLIEQEVRQGEPIKEESKTPIQPAERHNVAKPDELQQRESRYIGIIIHLALQHIYHTGYQQWTTERIQQQHPIWRVQLAQQGINPLTIPHALSKVHAAIRHTLEDPRGQWLLSQQHADSHTEYALWDHKGQHIIDRTFIDNNDQQGKTRWIIDYKSSEPAPGQNRTEFLEEQQQQHQAQLERYRALFKKKMVGEECYRIRTALYFPLLQAWVDISD